MLDITELGAILESVGVRRDAYSIDGSLGDERLVLLRDGHHWVTFYSERGLRTDPRSFANEREACEYFGRALLADRSTRVRPLGTLCALCGRPTRELWAIKRPRFLDVVKTLVRARALLRLRCALVRGSVRAVRLLAVPCALALQRGGLGRSS